MSTQRSVPVVSLVLLALMLGVAAVPCPAGAQLIYFFGEDEVFDQSIPSPAEFLGYELGTHHTRHDRIVAYLQELARSSDRATYQEIGRTVEHRVMPVLTVTAPENHARLEEIRRTHLAALDPREEAVDPAARPVIVHLGYGVHGNETSSAEAAMLGAYWLVAGEGDDVSRYLREGVYHIEPVLNPDGRDRHTHWANMHKADPFVADPLDREHNEAWPGGRTNHYWFDLNRDWLPLEHPESRARIDFHHGWKANVVTDYHEMGTNNTYFFEPTKPVGSWNPLIPEKLYRDMTLRFADRWAASLDSIGSLYFTKEVYDNTYPGYGSTYPNFLGGLGLVFEQAGARGHEQESTRHGVLTFAFTIRNHLRTSLATVRAAVEDRERLLEYQRDFFVDGLEDARSGPVRAWVFGDPHNASLNREFLDLLLRHRIQVHRLDGAVEAGGRSFEEGSAWVVPAEQPGVRLARSIFEKTETFADSVFYDASTWTMSLAYGIPHAELTSGEVPLGDRVDELPAPAGLGQVAEAGTAYLLDWSDYYAPRALQYLLARGVHAEAAFQPFTARTHGGEHGFPRGSISVPVQPQEMGPSELHRLVLEAEERAGVRFRATETGYSVEGVDLGSRNFQPVPEPRVLMVIGRGVSGYEAGQAWHLLDTRVDLPVTKVDRDDLGRAELSEYDVVLLVSGAQGAFGGEGEEELRRWVARGGTLVAIRSAAGWAVDRGFAPRAARAAEGADEEEAEEGGPERREWADAAAIAGAQQIGGSIYEVELDITHPVAFGYRDRRLPVWRDHSIILPPSANPYSTVAALTDEPHLSGYISQENLERLRGSASVLADGVGRGSVILFLDNPNFRGYWYGTNRLFLNALYFGRHVSVPSAP